MPLDLNFKSDLPAALLGARVRAARRKANLTLREIGQTLGVSTAMVCNYESGNSRMPMARLTCFADALGIPLDQLLEPQQLVAPPSGHGNAPWGQELNDLLQMVDRPEVQAAMVRLMQSMAGQAMAGQLLPGQLLPGQLLPGRPSAGRPAGRRLPPVPRTPQQESRAARRLPPALAGEPSAEACLAAELQADMVRSGAGLHLNYQPIIAASGELSGFEALVRWTTQEDVSVPAEDIIALATGHGFAEALDFWVIQEACTDAAAWLKQDRTLTVSVNVTGNLLSSETCVNSVEALLRGSHIPPAQLCIEVTETVLLNDRVISNLQALRNLGLRLAIDDFGTGQSSLARLMDLKVDVVKLDRSFFLDRQLDAEALAFLKAVVAMAHQRGSLVVAEGIASAADAELARSIGSDALQGFWYAEALTVEAVRASLHSKEPAWQPRRKPRSGMTRRTALAEAGLAG